MTDRQEIDELRESVADLYIHMAVVFRALDDSGMLRDTQARAILMRTMNEFKSKTSDEAKAQEKG